MPRGYSPPDECIEITLWEKFGWGPEQTDRLPTAKLRKIFAILEQRRVSHDKMENLGKPTAAKADALARRMAMEASKGGLKTGRMVDENGNPI